MRKLLLAILLALPGIAFAQSTAVRPGVTRIVRGTSTSDAATAADYRGSVAWKSTAAANKTQTSPVCDRAASGASIGAIDHQGDAAMHPIHIVGQSGSEVGGKTTGISIEHDKGSAIPVCDGASDWMVAAGIRGGPPPVPPSVVSLVPASSAFPSTNAGGNSNNGLLPNGGAATGTGAFGWPSPATDSFAIYNEFQVGQITGRLFAFANTHINYAYGVTVGNYGPSLFIQPWLNNFPWWLATTGVQGIGLFSNPVSYNPRGAGYNDGIFTWTASDACPAANGVGAREPKGVLTTLNGAVSTVDYGFLCGENANALGPKVEVDKIPGFGGNQRTGPGSTPAAAATTCTTNSPVAGQFTVTFHVGVPHGKNPGENFKLAGYTPTGYNGDYVALPGTQGVTLVGTTRANNGVCPAAVTTEGNVGSGAGGVITINRPASNVFNLQFGTGIRFKWRERVCGVFGEFGTDSNFPGGQFADYIDANTGEELPGSPAVVPWLNQGATNFSGSVTGNTLNVTAMTSTAIQSASFNATTGYATFTLATPPDFIPGSEFTVSGVNQAGYNRAYVAVAGTSGATVVGQPLSRMLGLPQAMANPGAGAGGSMKGVIMPGMTIVGGNNGMITPFGTHGTTGVGQEGTYGLTASGTSIGSSKIFAIQSYYYTASAPAGVLSVTPRSVGVTGGLNADLLNAIGTGNPTIVTGGNAAGWNGSVGDVGMYQGKPWPTAQGVPSHAALLDLCHKKKTFHQWASTYGGDWRSFYPLSDGGIWGDAGLARFKGYLSGASGSSATLHIVGAVDGSLAGSGSATLSGPGVPGCPQNCPTVARGSSPHAVTWASAIAANVGSAPVPVPMALGTYKPAKPLGLTKFNGQISGSTLTVNSMTPVATFDGTFNPATNVIASTNISGTVAAAQCVHDHGGNINPLQPLCINAWTSPNATVSNRGNYYSSSFTSHFSTYFGAIILGQYVMDGGGGIKTPVVVTDYLNVHACANGIWGCGTYKLSTNANGTVSARAMFMSGVSGGGEIGHGALTIDDLGFGRTFTIEGVNDEGPIVLTGEYSAGALGAEPRHIQAEVLSAPHGPPLSCCNWHNLSAQTIGDGKWSGRIPNVPLGGPYWVAVRAADEPDHSTLSNAVYVGANIALGSYGNGSVMFMSAEPPSYLRGVAPWVGFQGALTSGNASIPGPDYLPNWSPGPASQYLNDRNGNYGTTAGVMYAGDVSLSQNASSMLDWAPVGLVNFFRGGTGWSAIYQSLYPGTQTIGIGDGASTTFSSAPGYGGVVRAAAVPNLTASITGDTMAIAALGGVNYWSYVGRGIEVACGPPATRSCGAGGPPSYSGIIVGSSALGNSAAGSYVVSPPPGSNIPANTAFKVTQNKLVPATVAWLSGALFDGSVAGDVLTVNTMLAGAMAPLQTLSDTAGMVPPGVTVTACLTGCLPQRLDFSGAINERGSTWRLSQSVGTVAAERMALEPAGGAPMPSTALPSYGLGSVTGASPQGVGANSIIKAGTFEVLVNGAVVCRDNTVFAYNQQLGNCVGATVASGWLNYLTGDYSIRFNTAPANGATIVAKWTTLKSRNNTGGNEQIDYTGTRDSATSGLLASATALTGGVSGYYDAWWACAKDAAVTNGEDYVQAIAHAAAYTFSTRLGDIPYGKPGRPRFLASPQRVPGGATLWGANAPQEMYPCEAYMDDAPVKSEFSGTISGAGGASGNWTATLTLNGNSVGPVWEGEIIECRPYSLTCKLPRGAEIVGLLTGVRGVSGSTYSVASKMDPFSAVGPLAMHNALYGEGNIYAGMRADIVDSGGPPTFPYVFGPDYEGGTPTAFGAWRHGARTGVVIGAALSGHPERGTYPNLSRAALTECGGAASPCFDTTTGYPASHAATWIGDTFTISGGLAAGTRPFAPGMTAFCSGCNANLVVIAVSAPPTESNIAGEGQVGQTFTVKVNGAIGGSGSGTLEGRCGVRNCIDVAIDVNTTGTYATASAIMTCGVNNIQGEAKNAPFDKTTQYLPPRGVCKPTGVGALVNGGIRIGTQSLMSVFSTSNPYNLSLPGSVYDNSVDQGSSYGRAAQDQAFTCNIVAAKRMQCVHGPVYASGSWSAGQWKSGDTFMSYGAPEALSGSLMGYVGGQSFPVTPGSGYPDGEYVTGAVCPLAAQTHVGAIYSAMKFNVRGGQIVNAFPTDAGASGYQQCSYPLSFGGTANITNSAGTTARLEVTTLSSPATIATGEKVSINGQTLTVGPQSSRKGGSIGGKCNFGGLNIGIHATACMGTPPNDPGVTNVGGVNIANMGANIFYSVTCATTCANVTGASFTVGPQTGTGGSITPAPVSPKQGIGGIATYDTDNDLLGTYLYDNTGLPGNPLEGRFTHPSGIGYTDPGLPLKPFGQRRGIQVSG